MKLTDEFGAPTVRAAQMMFDAHDRVRAHREAAPLAQRPMVFAATAERAARAFQTGTKREREEAWDLLAYVAEGVRMLDEAISLTDQIRGRVVHLSHENTKAAHQQRTRTSK